MTPPRNQRTRARDGPEGRGRPVLVRRPPLSRNAPLGRLARRPLNWCVGPAGGAGALRAGWDSFMQIVGIGTDIVECPRIGRMIEQHGELFLRRVYTEWEIRYCQAR